MRRFNKLLIKLEEFLPLFRVYISDHTIEKTVRPASKKYVIKDLMNIIPIHSVAISVDHCANNLAAVDGQLGEEAHAQTVAAEMRPSRRCLLVQALQGELICTLIPEEGLRAHAEQGEFKK